VPALLSLASVLAAADDGAARNGKQAIDLAERAGKATGFQDPYALAVVAAAYAETGQFGEAVYTAERALQLAQTEANEELAERIRGEIALYRAKKPCRRPAALLKNMRHPSLARCVGPGAERPAGERIKR
jgi:pyruvate-formate lyase